MENHQVVEYWLHGRLELGTIKDSVELADKSMEYFIELKFTNIRHWIREEFIVV